MLTPAVYRRNALFELDSRIATARHHPLHRSHAYSRRLSGAMLRLN